MVSCWVKEVSLCRERWMNCLLLLGGIELDYIRSLTLPINDAAHKVIVYRGFFTVT